MLLLIRSPSVIRAGINPGCFVLPARSISFKPDFSKYKKIPQPPGNIVGTVNDAAKIPLVSYYDGGYHWTYERLITVGLVPLAMSPLIGGVDYPMIDSIFAIGLLFHCHAGFKSCIIDYIPERVWGVWHRIACRILTFGTFTAMYGIYNLETENEGLFDLVKSIWNA